MIRGVVTFNLLRVAKTFVQASSTCNFTAYQLTKDLGMGAASVWDTMMRLEGIGWLKSELVDTSGRSRRLYSLTEHGRESAKAQLGALQFVSTGTMLQRSA